MKYLVGIIFLSVLVSAQSVYADRGSIPFKPNVIIYEPKQRAMIAWNGAEEILILSTDLKASEPTKVLEVIPLPSKPKVKKGDVEIFKKATTLINSKLPRSSSEGVKSSRSTHSDKAAEVTFHEKIGAHDISVTRVLNKNGFIKWVTNYLKTSGVKNPKIPDDLKAVINEYLEEKFVWFVFDVISLDNKPKTNDAIQYRFKTNRLYYPLKITKTEKGHTSVELMILSPKLFSKFPGIPMDQVKLRHAPVSISSRELRELSEEIDDMLEHRKKMKLRIWHITGELSSFNQDLIAY